MTLHLIFIQLFVASKLQSLLSLEASNGPLPGHTPAIRQVLAYVRKVGPLQPYMHPLSLYIVWFAAICNTCTCEYLLPPACITQIRNADGEKDVAMRQLLYSMLVLQGDQSAQKV